ncbi:MAG: bifunctional folylpolyglutamate synthase/dihydrofolate synthase [Thermodesulfobacteriota bacterium]
MKTPSTKETLDYLYSLQTGGIKPGLERMEALLGALGSPESAFPSIHIAGTNGKGSTAAMTESVLRGAGFRTGLYTSPHLARFNERMRVSGRQATDAQIACAARTVRSALRRLKGGLARPSFFEFTTAMAFVIFREKKVDVAVLETGMGGRWDATNVVTPLVSVITNVGREHTQYLGTTIAGIAAEKAGIIKPGVPVVTTETRPTALGVIKAAARRAGSALYVLGRDFAVTPQGGTVSYAGIEKEIKGLALGLRGPFQAVNAAASLAAIEVIAGRGLKVPVKAIREGLKEAEWPGRFEAVCRSPLVILDSAHNPAGAGALAQALAGLLIKSPAASSGVSRPYQDRSWTGGRGMGTLKKFKRLILVAGVMEDKDIAGILKPLAPMADTIILAAPEMERAAPVSLLRRMLKRPNARLVEAGSVRDACASALAQAGPGDAVVVTGSIFTVGEARGYLLRRLKRKV